MTQLQHNGSLVALIVGNEYSARRSIFSQQNQTYTWVQWVEVPIFE